MLSHPRLDAIRCICRRNLTGKVSDPVPIICMSPCRPAVMTGMGADGTEGIGKLKASKKSYVIAQDQDTSVVFGMPKSIIAAGLADQVVPLDQIAQEIILHVGVVK